MSQVWRLMTEHHFQICTSHISEICHREMYVNVNYSCLKTSRSGINYKYIELNKFGCVNSSILCTIYFFALQLCVEICFLQSLLSDIFLPLCVVQYCPVLPLGGAMEYNVVPPLCFSHLITLFIV